MFQILYIGSFYILIQNKFDLLGVKALNESSGGL
jgi:hypothetical protein